MRTLRFLLPLAALVACSDDAVTPDATPVDTMDVPPPPPALGVQIERMGRPVINTALVGLRDADPTMKRDAYNAASAPAEWATAPIAAGRTILAELAANLALLDVLDQGNQSIAPPQGCRNQLVYNGQPQGGGTAVATSYHPLARVLADDMVYVDTSRTTCSAFLAVEIDFATGGMIPHMHCGGRTPTHDIADVSYSALLAGTVGFSQPPAMIPRIGDGVPVRTDLSDTAFPYFAPPR